MSGVTVVWDDPNETAAIVSIKDSSGGFSTQFTVGGVAVTFPYSITATTKFVTTKNDTYTVSVLVGGHEAMQDPDAAQVFRLDGDGVVVRPTLDTNLLSAALAPSLRPNTWASIGDSISARASGTTNGTGGSSVDRRSWQSWTNVILGQRLEPVTSFAVSGKMASEMLTEQLPQVVAMSPRPGYCTLLGGTNDLNNGQTDVQVIASLKAIIDSLVANGIRPIVGTITPRPGFSATQNKYLVRVNNWIRTYCPQVGAVLVDWNATMVDNAGAPKSNILGSDNIHPTALGAVYMARVAAAALTNVIPAIDRLPVSNLESPNPNILSNPLMTGTAGTKWDAGITGNVATNWIARSPDGTAVTVVGSKITRTVNASEWQQLAQSAGNGIQLYQSVVDTTRWAAGDRIYGLVEFEADSDLSGATLLDVFLQAIGGQTSQFPAKIGDDVYTGPVAVPTSGVFRTPSITVASGLTDLRLYFKVTGGTPTFRIGRAAILKEN